MKKLITLMLCAVALISCHEVEKYDNDAAGNFDMLWTTIDEHYCFFREKNIDWDAVYREYRARITPETSYLDLYVICSDMLDELRDGHVNLISAFSTSSYKKWWSDYPQNYDQRLVDQYYLKFGGLTRSGLTYAIMPDSVAYFRYPSFAYPVGEATLDWAFALISPAKALVFDIRDNGGGDLTMVESFVRRFINHRITAGYITHKTGPGHDDFSEPYEYFYDPAPEPRIHWDKPVVVLTNRSTFSAANNFVAVMHLLPQVCVVGDRTGGGSGMPFNSEMPCGWSVRFSASPVYDAKMQTTEFGIEPDIHVDLDPEQALQGIDTMLDCALAKALEMANNSGK